MNLINGKEIAEKIYNEIKTEIVGFNSKPKLGIILANNDEASERYVRIKSEKAKELGIEVDLRILDLSEDNLQNLKNNLEKTIQEFNLSSETNGYLIQLPLHKSIINHTDELINKISPEKDIDGLTAMNLGKTAHLDNTTFIPATVEGVLECINITLEKRINWLENNEENDLKNKNIVIINNSNLIGKPLSNILVSKNATVTILNKFSKNISEFTKNADILISATGQSQLLKADDFKAGAVVIDITSKKVDGKIYGDVIMSEDLQNLSWLTPVPGGAGPLTVAYLMKNLIKAYKNSN